MVPGLDESPDRVPALTPRFSQTVFWAIIAMGFVALDTDALPLLVEAMPPDEPFFYPLTVQRFTLDRTLRVA